MQEHVSNFPGAGPLTGFILTTIGFGGFCVTKAATFLADAPHVVAQAASPPGADAHAQTIYGAMVVVGAVISGWSLIQGKMNDARRAEEKKDDDARRDREFKDAMARIEIDAAATRVALDLKHAENRRRLDRQDEALDAIKQAVTPPATPEAAPEPK